jgi:hypothetical protein
LFPSDDQFQQISHPVVLIGSFEFHEGERRLNQLHYYVLRVQDGLEKPLSPLSALL